MKLVKIQSSKTICVTSALSYEDVTNPDAHVPDRLKVNPTWMKDTCLIKEGIDWYPENITKWHSVQRLVDVKVLTIGETRDDEVIETITEEPKPRRGRRPLDEM